MRTIFILLDSLNRRMLPAYGNNWVKTPTIDRLASSGVVFENHYCGSMPCIPARRDLMTGRLNFLETGWGPLEPWDDVLTDILREKAGVYSHMITDHCHYFNGGAGDRYQNAFDSWEYMRGQPWDPWHGVVNPKSQPDGARYYCYGEKYHQQHLSNLEYRDSEKDESYSSVQCIQAACEFVERNHGEDSWHLHLELFDPHEPFDCPQVYLEEYGDTWTGPQYTCPDYSPLNEEVDTREAVEHVRNAYAATLSMTDRWLGKLFDLMDRLQMWRDTSVILTTDHGYLLGEHGLWAKNYMMCYNELVQLPLIVHNPHLASGPSERRRRALTGAIDIMPTILDLHGIKDVPKSVIGRSIVPLLEEDGDHHEGLLFGYFGREVNVTDGRYSYHRMPADGSTVDYHFSEFGSDKRGYAKNAVVGTHLKWCKEIPHFRIGIDSRKPDSSDGRHLMFDLQKDSHQNAPVTDEKLEEAMAEKLKKLMAESDAPECQYRRLGL